MNLTWNKAAIGGLAAPIAAYLLTFLQDWTLSIGHPIPDAAVAALQALLVGLAVFYVPNADPTPDVAGLQARLAELEAAAKAAKPLLALVVMLVGAGVLGGCAGMVDSLAGRTSAGGGLAASQHVTQDKSKSGCPDFSAQGALQVSGMNAYCSDSPTMGHSESFSVQSADPNEALRQAFAAQTATNAQLMTMIGGVLQAVAPFLVTAASGGAIPPVRPPVLIPAPPSPRAPIILTPPGGGEPAVVPQ